MSALAHMIETRGIATTVVGLVRSHMEKSKPPRGVWVPFPLGRPFGEPEDKAFQRRVLMAALDLLARPRGPVLLEDFPDDAPSMKDAPGWRVEVALPARPAALPTDARGWQAVLEAEIAAVRPHWEAAQTRFGRSTVGNSRLAPEDWAAYAVRFLGGEIPESPVAGVSPAVVLRYVADDVKAFLGEAAQAIGPQPSSAQVNHWLWGETMWADMLRTLRGIALTSAHTGFNTAGSRFVVPAPFVEKPR